MFGTVQYRPRERDAAEGDFKIKVHPSNGAPSLFVEAVNQLKGESGQDASLADTFV